MEKKIENALKKAGLDYRHVTLMFGEFGENTRPGIMVAHDYEGPYPTDEARALHHKALAIAAKYGCRAEARGYYTATLIYC